MNDREICKSFVSRAEAAGYRAIVVTLDTLTLGWRPRDLRRAYLPFIRGEGCGQYFTDPVFTSRLDKPPEEDLLTAAAMMLATFPNLGLTWDDLDWLRGQTSLPLLVKGVLTADDAQLALDHGMDGVVVSNHGGRQVDGAVAALDALVEVRDALPEAVVLMDGGIRRARRRAEGGRARRRRRPARTAVRLRARGRGAARRGGADPEPDGGDRPEPRSRRRALDPRPRPLMAESTEEHQTGRSPRRARLGRARGDPCRRAGAGRGARAHRGHRRLPQRPARDRRGRVAPPRSRSCSATRAPERSWPSGRV